MPIASARYAIARFAVPCSLAIIALAALSRNAAADPACPGQGQVAQQRGLPEPCGHVEERLRVDPRARREMSPWGGANAFAPMPESGAMPAHQRLNGGFGQNTPRLR